MQAILFSCVYKDRTASLKAFGFHMTTCPQFAMTSFDDL
jgi:hypothetical protein